MVKVIICRSQYPDGKEEPLVARPSDEAEKRYGFERNRSVAPDRKLDVNLDARDVTVKTCPSWQLELSAKQDLDLRANIRFLWLLELIDIPSSGAWPIYHLV